MWEKGKLIWTVPEIASPYQIFHMFPYFGETVEELSSRLVFLHKQLERPSKTQCPLPDGGKELLKQEKHKG